MVESVDAPIPFTRIPEHATRIVSPTHAKLIAGLESAGYLDNTIVVVTSDHGEHLGEHHMLEHQFSLYEGLIHVPLIIRYPPKFAAGREPRPVSNLDLFPTLLELAGIGLPSGSLNKGISLLSPEKDRLRLAEYPVAHASVDNAARRHGAQPL